MVKISVIILIGILTISSQITHAGIQRVTLCQHGADGHSQNIEVPVAVAPKLIEKGAYPGTCEEEELYGNRFYISHDVEYCSVIRWLCEEGQQVFYDETGCGCEPI